MLIFGVNAGRVMALETYGGVPALFKMDGFRSSTALIQSVGISQGANVQFVQSLKDKIYIYAFGEAPGVLTVSGILLLKMCESSRGGSDNSGLKDVLEYYKKNSVSVRSEPITIVTAGNTLSGYLRQVDGAIDNPEAGMGRFTFTLTAIPK